MAVTPDELAKQISAALPTELKCVALYGSAAAGDFVQGKSNFNVLIIAEPLALPQLDRLTKPLTAWHRAGHPMPLIFTPQQLLQSASAFPIEMLDIQQSRRVLCGSDPLADLQISPAHLHQQVQRELNGKLLKLRNRYVLAAGKEATMAQLMLDSLSTFLVLFRAALRLQQKQVPDVKMEALRELQKYIAFDAKPFEALNDYKLQPIKSRTAPPAALFSSYFTAIESVTEAINCHTYPQQEKP